MPQYVFLIFSSKILSSIYLFSQILSSQIICDVVIWKLLLYLIKPLWKAPSLKSMVIYIYLKDHSSNLFSGSETSLSRIKIFNILFLYLLTIFSKVNIAQVSIHIYLESFLLVSNLPRSILWRMCIISSIFPSCINRKNEAFFIIPNQDLSKCFSSLAYKPK